MVFNKRDLSKAFSPSKPRRVTKKRLSINGTRPKPSTSGGTSSSTTRGTGSESASQTSIKVIVRVRPENEREQQGNWRNVVKIVDDRMLIFDPKEEEHPFFYQGVVQKGRDLLKKQNKELQFIFDRVFDNTSNNEDVFEGSTKTLISSLLDGYNCSVFAYGATGAGKTHTMLGNENDPGITYRTMAELFSQIEKEGERREFNLGVTYLEVYNENVQDLLHNTGPLYLRDDGRCGVIVAGLKIIPIQSAEELLSLLARGNKNRTQHPTDANAESSRSHAVFQVYINITNKLNGQVRQVKLSMIDLAGSERASATGCSGARFKEGANINKSLLALGNCINNLADGAKHITYRDSKLTRLLKDSLGGNCQTVMIANIAPSNQSYEDTYNTLRYANRAKKIKTHVKKNILSCEMHVAGYIKMLEEQKKEIDLLKQKLSVFESGQMPVAPLESKNGHPSVVATNAHSTEITNKMIELLEKKKLLNEKILNLESTDKILCCRIQFKKAADKRLNNLTAAVNVPTFEEQSGSGKSRVNKSLLYFERQRDSLRIQINAAWEELRLVEMELLQLTPKALEDPKHTVALRNCEIEMSRMQQQCQHAKKVCNLQQCEMHSLYLIIKAVSTTLQNYYNIMRGHGTMTDKLKEEFKQLVKLLEGVRNIKWSDMETTDQEEHFYSLTCLSIPELTDPLNSTVPIYTMGSVEEDIEENSHAKEKLNLTFDSSSSKTDKTIDLYNVTISLPQCPTTVSLMEGLVENDEKCPVNGNSLPNKAKKRVLTEHVNHMSRTPTKQQKKILPKEKCALDSITTTGKENERVQKSHAGMTAKSIAILNKLKADKLKKHTAPDTNVTNASLKLIREKERRGLMSTHPYHKPNDKQKFTPASSSSRAT